ncbi:FliM/FliN family flagellar motor switch protein, partial [Methylobacterium hispanicum]
PDRPDETRQEGPTSMSSSMSSSTSSSTLVPTAEPRGADLDAGLDVALDLDIGSVTVPLAEIETWQVGSLVALDPEIPRDGLEVVLRVNGRAVGAGELVRIDDRFAVRLVRLALG